MAENPQHILHYENKIQMNYAIEPRKKHTLKAACILFKKAGVLLCFILHLFFTAPDGKFIIP